MARNAEEEVGEVRPGESSGEGEAAAWILLGEDVHLVPFQVAADREVVPAAAHERVAAHGVRLVARESGQSVVQARDAARKAETRWSPVHRFLVVAIDSSIARYVGSIREVRRGLVRLARELITEAQRHELRDAVTPVHLRIHCRRSVLVFEAEQVVCVGRRPLIRHVAEHLVPLVDVLRETRLHALLSHDGEDRDFVVVSAVRLARGLRIVAEQRRRLRADAIARDGIAGKRKTRQRVDDLHRAPRCITALREVAGAFERRGHQPRLREGVVVGQALKSDEDVESILQARNLHRTTKGPEQVHVVVVGSRSLDTGERIRPGVPHRVAEETANHPVIERARASSIVPEGRGLRER